MDQYKHIHSDIELLHFLPFATLFNIYNLLVALLLFCSTLLLFLERKQHFGHLLSTWIIVGIEKKHTYWLVTPGA